MGMQMRLIEALVDADPDADYSNAIRVNQRSTFFMKFLRLGFTSD